MILIYVTSLTIDIFFLLTILWLEVLIGIESACESMHLFSMSQFHTLCVRFF